MTAILIEKLAVAYGSARVIEDLSLTIDDRQSFTLLGPSGCGKTTLLRALAGFLPVIAGRILFGDKDVSRMPAHQRDIASTVAPAWAMDCLRLGGSICVSTRVCSLMISPATARSSKVQAAS
jgi:ABC-type Fe3+/spermidine/putrescine transport system ATPase subunit